MVDAINIPNRKGFIYILYHNLTRYKTNYSSHHTKNKSQIKVENEAEN